MTHFPKIKKREINEILEKLKSDPYAQFLGVKYEEVKNGYARCSIEVTENMLNFSGFPHGGLLFSLADVAFSGAAASVYMPTTALNIAGNFCGVSKEGSKLVAEAKLKNESRRFSYFDITVKEGEKLIASFTGMAYKIHEK